MSIQNFKNKINCGDVIKAGLLTLCLPAPALAQLPPQIQPGQIERQFTRPPQAPSAPSAPVELFQPTQKAPANAAAIKFTLKQIVLEGVQVYQQIALQPLYAGLLNREITFADIYALANTLTTRYRNDGYVLSQVVVPAQSVENGVVRLQAIEGYVDQVKFEGAEVEPGDLLQVYAQKIQAQRPLRAATLERYLLLMNDLPGAFVRATLIPSNTQRGAADILLQVTQNKVLGGFSIDNRGSESLGFARYMADVELNSALGLQEKIGARVATSGDKKLEFESVSYEQPLGTEGGKINLTLNRVRSTPNLANTFIVLDTEVASDSATLNYLYPMLRSRSENFYVRAGLSAYDGESKLFGVRETKDNIRALRIGVNYDLADRFNGVNTFDLEYAQGLRALGASRTGDNFLSRASGRPDFSKLNLFAARLQGLSDNWSLLGAISGQYAFNDLLSPELYSYGGEQFGRGYIASELTGDHGAAMKLELRYRLPPSWLDLSTLYGFYDVGTVRQRSPGGLAASQSAASAGAGLRFSLGQYLSGFVEFAKPLTRPRAEDGRRDTQGYAGLSLRF